MNESPENGSKFESTVRKMSHEVRTPLTSIMGFAELLLEDESLTGKTREYLTVISEESRKLSAMVNSYLSTLLVESANTDEGADNTKTGL